MRLTVYMRVATDRRRRTQKAHVNLRPTARPLSDAGGEPLPTVAFAVELVVPDAMFEGARQVIASLTIPESAARIAADVVLPEAVA